MFQHFQVQTILPNQHHLGWKFSFFYNQRKITGLYYPNGRIHWECPLTFLDLGNKDKIEKQIHDLMIFHIYDHER
ncbi:DUF5342 family protein [Lederbergia galactosidilytica]|uniref:YheE family protein n=1 Tax=Lederbergia galactosidilytica TaxID=217031 RepID=A0A0Q9Y7J7_9BACI|nr:DUF5342 family protein [Lederbergia galactosidilytica]KRG16625.1 hypothetical protein ACA30_00375 [Virgibacillus soli]KRG16796.1 hypothetical protein ACA29_03350 [Lederbergia galactosidilytica]MBP1915746.1 hypothetical protein [Lederbergia galactosidilytica]OAK75868.1 hypothetical protein ABB05_00070 [Lederbergia galactosidilytica]